MPSPYIAIAISGLAAVVAFLALWRTHFARGRLIWAAGTASISITGWMNRGKRWFTPDIAIPVSIANTGALPITVRGLRLKVSFPDLPIPNAHEFWDLNQELDLETELTHGMGRTALEAVKGAGTPFVILQKSTTERRFLFWCRWEKPVTQRMQFELQALTSASSRWKAVESYDFNLVPDAFVYLADEGGRFGMLPTDQIPTKTPRDARTVPADLHKYTGPTDPLPKKSTKPGTSFVVGSSGSAPEDDGEFDDHGGRVAAP